MSYRKDRDETIAALTRNGVPLDAARKVLRYAATLQRLAVTRCNRETTPRENASELRTTERLLLELTPRGIKVDVNGDPRGYVVKVHFADGSYNTWGGKESGFGIAAR